ncbi:MAG: alpha/beta fold hydrolase [Isosphaeraceae bacterium]
MPGPFHVRFLRRVGESLSSTPVRVASWLVLLAITGILVKAEALRPKLPEGTRLTADLVYRDDAGRRVRLDVYRPDGPPPATGFPVLVAIHGGGWRGGSKGEYGRSLLPLVRKGIALVAVDYQLASPGSPAWPASLTDVLAALDWVGAHARDYDLDRDRVALIGASAGAHLALMAAFPPERVTSTDLARTGQGKKVQVKAVIDFYGPTDLARLHESSPGAAGPVEGLTGGSPSAVPEIYREASPRWRVRRGGPPVLIYHGTEDLLVPPEQSIRLAEALETAGVEHRLVIVPGARHGFGLHAETSDFVPGLLEFVSGAWED